MAKVDNPLKVFSIETNEGLKIHKDALRVVYNYNQEDEKEVEQPQLTTGLKEEVEPKETVQMKIVSILQKELEEQRKSNLLKDEQIQNLMEMLKQTQCMLDQEQKLNAINAKRILQLEESKENQKERKRKSFF